MPINRQNFRPVRDSIRSAANSVPRNLQVPIEDGNYGMLLMFRDYQYQAPGTRGFASPESSNITDTIFLPLPENISDNFEIRVQRFDQGALGAIISETMAGAAAGGGLNISTFQDAAIKAIQEALPSAATDGAEFQSMIANAFRSLSGGGGNLSSLDNFSTEAAFLLRKALPGNVGRSVDAGTGTFINPKAALSFEGVEMKAHNFNWTVAPKSASESENLRNVIRTINRNILPQYIQGELTQRAMFRYPSMVDIFFVGLDSSFYYFFKTAMVRTFNVNYTPNGVSVLRGGRPAAVQMQMAVMETDIHTAEDYGALPASFGGSSPTSTGIPTVQ
jgi:hypothetical protein